MVQPEEGTHPDPSSLYPSTASVPIAVLLYNGPLLCSFNVPNGQTETGGRHIQSGAQSKFKKKTVLMSMYAAIWPD